jgi:hypothetical protein
MDEYANKASIRPHYLPLRQLLPQTSNKPMLCSLTRSVLPALASLGFKGDSEYLGELIAQIDAPQLVCLSHIFLSGRLGRPTTNTPVHIWQ